jgi:xanthine dehydrogenase accessory factor
MAEHAKVDRNLDLLAKAADLVRQRRSFVLAIVVETVGSTSARTGSKALFDSEGILLSGWVGGGCAESTVAHSAVESLETKTGQIVDVDLNDEVLGAGMPCGGSMKIYVEPVVPSPIVWILGHGRVAECLCRLSAEMGMEVVVNDGNAPPERFPQAREIIADDATYGRLTPRREDFVVVATQHRGDHQSLRRLLSTDVGYIALVASKKRAGLIFNFLREAGFDKSALDRVRSPSGLAINARTPEEIALSVMAEIVMVRRSRASNEASSVVPAVMSLVG